MAATTVLAAALLLSLAALCLPAPASASVPDVINDPILQALFPVSELRDLTGYNGARTYLFLGQNSYELRPTGGFISRVGLVRFQSGEATMTWLRYTYDIDEIYKAYLVTHPGEREPEPYEYYPFGHDSWYLRDKNWWPDFKVTASEVQTLFAKEIRVYNQSVVASEQAPLSEPFAVDGVIAVDEAIGSRILAVVGAVTLNAPGQDYHGKILNADNFGLFSQWWENTNQGSQRGFFSATSAALKNAVDGATPAQESNLALALIRAFSEGHLLMQSNDIENQAALDKLGWGGRATSLSGDYLHVSDFNIGGKGPYAGSKPWKGNKVNMYVDRDLAFQATIDANRSTDATVVADYDNEGVPGYFDYLDDPNTPEPDYSILEGAYYRGWCRVFVPRTAVLTGASYEGEVRNVEDLLTGRRYFGSWVGWADGLDPGEAQRVRYRYRVPSVVKPMKDGYVYRLRVQKQAGTVQEHLDINISSPWLFITRISGLAATSSASHLAGFSTNLQYDKVLEMRLAPVLMRSPVRRTRRGRPVLLRGSASLRYVTSLGRLEVQKRTSRGWRLVAARVVRMTTGTTERQLRWWYRPPSVGVYRARAVVVGSPGGPSSGQVFRTGYKAFGITR